MSSFLEQLYWREPLWLLLAFFPLLLILWRLLQQRHSLRRYADAALLPWLIAPDVKKHNRRLLISQFLIWLLFGMAAAGPRLLLSAPKNLLPPQGAAVIIVDHSRSMQASDVFPDRLQQAQDVVTQWAQENSKLKLGLVVFAGASHIVLPVTSDKQVLQDTALAMNEIQLPTFGSAIVQSLQQAELLLRDETGARAIIMLTDGDVSPEKFREMTKFAKLLQQKKITLHLLGVGTPAPIALADSIGRWLRYSGETVVTSLQETALQSLAENKAVFYSRLNPAIHNSLINVWQGKPARIAVQNFNEVTWYELFPWLLLPALFLIVFNHLSIPHFVLPVIAIMCIVCSILPPSVYASTQADEAALLRQAYASWQNKHYVAAVKIYARVKGYSARMGEGASCFKNGQMGCAITAFSQAAWQAETDEQRGRAAFNLGNSFFRQGDFNSAITLYKDALRYQPQQTSYQNNLLFSEEVQRNIERRLQQEADSQKAAQRRGSEQAVDIDNARISEMNMVLGDKVKKEPLDKNLQLNLSEEQLAYYMQRSQNFARLSGSKNKSRQRQHDWSHFSNENPVAARRVEYWQRLFELEEGVPAHPDTPKVIPGVKPW